MKSYLIIYQLTLPESSYTNLISYLKSFSYWARPTAFSWIVKSDLEAGKIRDEIMARIGPSDKALTIQIFNNWGSYNISKNVAEWMKSNL